MNEVSNPKKKVLFLGKDETQTGLIDTLVANNCLLDYANTKLKQSIEYDFVISYGYRHILDQAIIDGFSCPIFNLHISYLPYNRGAHPNFWSFYDNTPSGITIHLVDCGIDTGPIIAQRYVNFDGPDDTFAKTYAVLHERIESLFHELLPSILSNSWSARPQRGVGTHHFARDLPSNFAGWNENIEQEIARLDKEGLKYDD